MSELKRYGLEWKSDKDFVCHPMDDGYWTPWHIAHEQITTLRQQLAKSEARVAELEDALVWALGKLSIEAPVTGGNVSYIRAFEKADKALSSNGKAWLLRKQAEAIEEAYKSTVLTQTIDDPYSDFGKGQDFGFDQAVTQFDEQMEKQVSHLRNQADESEKENDHA